MEICIMQNNALQEIRNSVQGLLKDCLRTEEIKETGLKAFAKNFYVAEAGRIVEETIVKFKELVDYVVSYSVKQIIKKISFENREEYAEFLEFSLENVLIREFSSENFQVS